MTGSDLRISGVSEEQACHKSSTVLHSSWLYTCHCLHPVFLAPRLGMSSWSVQGFFLYSSLTENYIGSRSMSTVRSLYASNCQRAMIFSHLTNSESLQVILMKKAVKAVFTYQSHSVIFSVFASSLHCQDCRNPNLGDKYH